MVTSLLDRMARRTSLRTNIGANYLGRIWEAAMNVAFMPIYIAHLGAEAFGIIGILAVIQSFMMIFDFGIGPALTREAARFEAGEYDPLSFKDLVRSSESIVLGVCVVIVAVVALAGSSIASDWVRADKLPNGTIENAIMVGGVLVAARFMESMYRGLLLGLQRQLLCNALAAFFATLRGVGAAVLVSLLGAGLPEFFAWQAAISIASVLAMRVGVGRALPRTDRPPRFSLGSLRQTRRFAGGMMLISALSLAATQGDKLILSRIVPLAEFGYYSFAVNVALLLQLTIAPLMTALYPTVVAHVSAGDETALRETFHRSATIVSGLTAPFAAILVIFGPTLVLVWSRNPTLAEQVGPLLSVVALGTYLQSLCILPYYVQIAYGWTSLPIWTNATALLITIPSLFLLAPIYGTRAAAWIWVAVASLYLFGSASILFSRYLKGSRTTFFLLDSGLPSVAAFGAAGLCAVMLDGVPRTLIGNVFVLAVATAASFGSVATVAWFRACAKWRRQADSACWIIDDAASNAPPSPSTARISDATRPPRRFWQQKARSK